MTANWTPDWPTEPGYYWCFWWWWRSKKRNPKRLLPSTDSHSDPKPKGKLSLVEVGVAGSGHMLYIGNGMFFDPYEVVACWAPAKTPELPGADLLDLIGSESSS